MLIKDLPKGEKGPKSFEEPVDELAGLGEFGLWAFFVMFDEDSADRAQLAIGSDSPVPGRVSTLPGRRHRRWLEC